ncbi:hypothetical protein L579_0091 [Pantoea sp. AS-PWVM4]|nr:hypothetical protein L579_0091 [Pantoea sp. AS-PWVM4]
MFILTTRSIQASKAGGCDECKMLLLPVDKSSKNLNKATWTPAGCFRLAQIKDW